jgi:hypothetical protein
MLDLFKTGPAHCFVTCGRGRVSVQELLAHLPSAARRTPTSLTVLSSQSPATCCTIVPCTVVYEWFDSPSDSQCDSFGEHNFGGRVWSCTYCCRAPSFCFL